ncbi:MAG: GNAT family N-acetyltransferase [Bacteroidales bacterium]|jgi:GNAT superfamily N-acetyltransferase|nr:GNAT family N-acetyltransferase [Bacteroidales bacterium]
MQIRSAQIEDIPEIITMITELAAYEKAVDEVSIRADQLKEDGFGKNPLFEVFIAENENDILGMAFCYKAYSTWKGRVFYLEDIIVKQEYRRMGIGAALFETVRKRAKDFGAARLQWQVLEWNDPAIQFYNKISAALDPEWINCKLNKEQL